MPDNNTTNDENKNLDTMDNTELLEYLWRGLNKANIGGIFTIDEAFTLKLIYEKLKKNIE